MSLICLLAVSPHWLIISEVGNGTVKAGMTAEKNLFHCLFDLFCSPVRNCASHSREEFGSLRIWDTVFDIFLFTGNEREKAVTPTQTMVQ